MTDDQEVPSNGWSFDNAAPGVLKKSIWSLTDQGIGDALMHCKMKPHEDCIELDILQRRGRGWSRFKDRIY